jgi:hypothetical protein
MKANKLFEVNGQVYKVFLYPLFPSTNKCPMCRSVDILMDQGEWRGYYCYTKAYCRACLKTTMFVHFKDKLQECGRLVPSSRRKKGAIPRYNYEG